MSTQLAVLKAGVLAALAGGLIGSGQPPRAGEILEPAKSVPWHVGEKLTYQAKVNFISAGAATMTVAGVDDVRGRPAYHSILDIHGRLLLFKVNDHTESWFDTLTMNSLRLVQSLDEGSYDGQRTYEFYPDKKIYIKNGETLPSVADPLDEGSFIYFMRTIPLEVGQTYTFNRYYHLDRNPVVIKVLRREQITVPAGTFDAVVLQPVIKSKGLFSENGQAEVWYTADTTRLLLRLKSKLPFGTLYLELKRADTTTRR